MAQTQGRGDLSSLSRRNADTAPLFGLILKASVTTHLFNLSLLGSVCLLQVEQLLEHEKEEDIPFFWFHSPREACVSSQYRSLPGKNQSALCCLVRYAT